MKHTLKLATVATLSAVLAACGSTPKNTAEELNKNIPDVVFLDIELPDLDGQTILKER